jgi:uncharacterized protein (TIGR02996 family)
MTDGDALRRTVVAAPDDDTPRLIYADWLDENSQSERATFIRRQVEAARAEPFSLQARTVETAANNLLEKYQRNWSRHLDEFDSESPRFKRGFIEHVDVEPTTFVKSNASILGVEPIQSLRIVRPETEAFDYISLVPVFELPQLQRIRHLEFLTRTLGFLDDEYVGLTRSPHLAQIQKLSLRGNPILPHWLSVILGSAAFPNLTALDIAEIPNLGPALLSAVNKANHRTLKQLDVSGVVFTSELLQRILTHPCLQNIEELRLGFSGFNNEPGPLFHLDVGWVIPWDRLVVLDLAGQRLGDGAVQAIVSRDDTRALRWLGLSKNDLKSEAVRLLLNSKHLSLNYLDVRGNSFTPSAIAALQRRFTDALIVF